MGYIFMDESGDLGFDFSKAKTSRYFVMTCLFAEQKQPIEKIVKKVFQTFAKTELHHHSGVLHCYKEHPRVRHAVLNRLNEKDISILTIYLKKSKVYTRLHDQKHIVYNYITNILLDRIVSKKLISLDSPIEFIASRRESNKFLNENFTSYVERQVQRKANISVRIATPQQEKCLQVVDFACWSVFRKYEHQDESYYNLFKRRVVEENPLFG